MHGGINATVENKDKMTKRSWVIGVVRDLHDKHPWLRRWVGC